MYTLNKIMKAYEKWVTANPGMACDVETTARWLSYFLAGRLSNSLLVSEMVHALSNILILYNDRIIQIHQSGSKTNPYICALDPSNANSYCYRLKFLLTNLEYCEVFIEISAKRLFGNKGKWLFITLLQLVKALGRFYILRHSNEQIITSPALPTTNRKSLLKKSQANTQTNGYDLQEHKIVFKLKRSGRVMRKVEGAPPLQYRSFNLADEVGSQQPQVPKELLQAEYMYIFKPLVHLFAMWVFGENTWKQYMVSVGMDLASIRKYFKNSHLMTKKQRLILSRRCLHLFLYLVRSPFYERFTKPRLEALLTFVANNVSFIRMLPEPLKGYMPSYQSIYFYLWST